MSARELDAPHRAIRLTAASDIPLRRTRWFWRDRLPVGALAVVAGREGIGKSLALVWLTAATTRGRLPGAHHGTPRTVVYCAAEDSWSHTVAPRLAAAGADLEAVYRLDVVDDGSLTGLTLPLDSENLHDEIKRVGAALLVIDPLVSSLAASLDTHRDKEVRAALEPLVQVADTTGAAIVGLVHHSKAQTTDANSLVLGSRAFTAVPRAALTMVRDSADPAGSVIVAQSKNNLGRADLPGMRYVIDSVRVETPEGPTEVGCLRWGDDVADVDLERLLRGARGDLDDEGCSDRSEVDEWLSDYLTCGGGQAAAADVFRDGVREGWSRDQIKRAKARLGVIPRKIGMSKGWVWHLPSQPEESTKGVKGAGHRVRHPSLPSGPPQAALLPSPADADEPRNWPPYPRRD